MVNIPQFLMQALNYNPQERQLMPYQFTGIEIPVLGITPAQVNVANGKVLIPGGHMQRLVISSFLLRVNSAGVGATNLYLRTTESTPVLIATFATAQLTSGALLRPGDTGVTLGAGFCVPLTAGATIVLCSSATSTPATATGAFTIDLLPLSLSAR